MDLFDRFLQERTYLKGVSPETLRYYKWVRRAFLPILQQPTKAGMLACVQKLLADGVSPISVNTYLRGFKAYTRWLNEEKLLDEVIKVQFLKTEQKVLATFTSVQVGQLIAYKATGTNLRRAHLVALTICDTGLRAGEVLGLTKEDIDFENCVFKVKGKGGKHRLVPLSTELRKHVWKYQSLAASAGHTPAFLFGTKNNTKLTVRNLERDFQVLGQKLGITGVRFSPHTLRHSFAVGYLRRGGNLEFLRRILGHSSILTTQKYLRSLGVEDLQAVHSRLSLLAR
jgi:integrase/recombinase XerD